MIYQAMMKRKTWFSGMAASGLLIGVALAATVSGCTSGNDSVAQVQVTAPSDGSSTRANRITVRGTVSPANANVQVLGQNAQVGNGIFTTSVPLTSGKNTIDVVAGGPGVTPATVTITVTRKVKKTTTTTNNGGNNDGSDTGGTRTGGTSTCGDGISVGPNTTCSFARNVASEYYSNPSSTIEVYSPVTGRWYTMSCSSGSPHVCTGGNNASVYFP